MHNSPLATHSQYWRYHEKKIKCLFSSLLFVQILKKKISGTWAFSFFFLLYRWIVYNGHKKDISIYHVFISNDFTISSWSNTKPIALNLYSYTCSYMHNSSLKNTFSISMQSTKKINCLSSSFLSVCFLAKKKNQ